jgi:hypothetical protein
MKYLNTEQQKKVKNYKYINDENFLENIKVGDYIKYIIKQNLSFRQGGIVEDILNNNIIQIKNTRYKYSYLVNCNDHIIFHKSKTNSKRDFMEYILKGLNNNTFKITKKNCD